MHPSYIMCEAWREVTLLHTLNGPHNTEGAGMPKTFFVVVVEEINLFHFKWDRREVSSNHLQTHFLFPGYDERKKEMTVASVSSKKKPVWVWPDSSSTLLSWSAIGPTCLSGVASSTNWKPRSLTDRLWCNCNRQTWQPQSFHPKSFKLFSSSQMFSIPPTPTLQVDVWKIIFLQSHQSDCYI